jgi:hypothetical protein
MVKFERKLNVTSLKLEMRINLLMKKLLENHKAILRFTYVFIFYRVD